MSFQSLPIPHMSSARRVLKQITEDKSFSHTPNKLHSITGTKPCPLYLFNWKHIWASPNILVFLCILVTVGLIAVERKHDYGYFYKTAFNWGLLTLLESESITITTGSLTTIMGTKTVDRSFNLIRGGNVTWTFESSKPIPTDILPPTRPHFLFDLMLLN